MSVVRALCNCFYYVVNDDVDIEVYQRPDEKPPGGTRFLLITCLVPFKAGTVVFISADGGV